VIAWAAQAERVISMTEKQRSEHESRGLRAVRPYLIVSDAQAAIEFYGRRTDRIGPRPSFALVQASRHKASPSGERWC
jgi:hypothetical protein